MELTLALAVLWVWYLTVGWSHEIADGQIGGQTRRPRVTVGTSTSAHGGLASPGKWEEQGKVQGVICYYW